MSSNIQGASGLTAALSSGGFAAAAGNINYTNASTITFVINGRFYSRATVASQAPAVEAGSGINPSAPNSFQPVHDGFACAFAILLDAAGTFTMMQGPIVEAGQACAIPQATANKVIVGAMKVSNASFDNSGNGFRIGTDAHNSAGLTTTFFNLSGHPGNSL